MRVIKRGESGYPLDFPGIDGDVEAPAVTGADGVVEGDVHAFGLVPEVHHTVGGDDEGIPSPPTVCFPSEVMLEVCIDRIPC